jgi:hypothetical protein
MPDCEEKKKSEYAQYYFGFAGKRMAKYKEGF